MRRRSPTPAFLLPLFAPALVLAGARCSPAGINHHLVVLLDTSASMAAVNTAGESARDRASHAQMHWPDFDEFWEKGFVEIPPAEKPYVIFDRFRADPVVQSVPGGIDHKADAEQIAHIATLIPDEWLAAAATGSPQQCAQRIRAELGYGADAVILHGATPDELEPVLAGYRAADG